jgi:hypothetical protein
MANMLKRVIFDNKKATKGFVCEIYQCVNINSVASKNVEMEKKN